MTNTVTKKNKVNLTTVFNIVCAVVLVAFFLVQFLPFWTYTTIEGSDKTAALIGLTVEEGEEVEKTISLAQYLWFTEEHEDLFGHWKRMKDFDGNPLTQNEIVVMPFLCTLLVILGTFFCLWKNDKTWTCLFALIVGVYATITYLTTPILQTGHTWIVHLIVSIIVLLGSLPLTALWVKKVIKWFTVKK